GGHRLGRGLGGLGRRLLHRLGLFGLLVADQAVTLRATTDAIGLSLLDRRGMALHPDPERDGEVESLFVGEAELFGELMDPDLSCHVRVQPFVGRSVMSRGGPACGSPLAADQSLTLGCRGQPAFGPSSSATSTGARSARVNAR